MSKEILKDSNNRTIGYIETMSDGRQRLISSNNQTLGYYDPKSNRTTNVNNQTIGGSGNFLMTLLR